MDTLPTMDKHGTVIAPDTLRFERVLPGPIERVWAYLTDPEKRAKWLAGGPLEHQVGGDVRLWFHHASLDTAPETVPEKYKAMEKGSAMNGIVTRWEPPKVLAYSWNDRPGRTSEVLFELSERGKDVLLVLTHHRLPDRKEMHGVSGGWHTHLDVLAAHLEGRVSPGFWTAHAAANADYTERLAKVPEPPATVTVNVTQHVAASVERVFNAWIDPKRLSRWMFGEGAPVPDEVIHIHNDVREGGAISFLVRRDGQEIDHVGMYLTVAPPRLLVFTWGIKGGSENDHSVVTVRIDPDDNGSTVRLSHSMDAKWADYAERTEQGWTRMLEVLAGQEQ